ncbi:MAG: four-helix bundle copper-binding protein [Nitrospirota bacterium]
MARVLQEVSTEIQKCIDDCWECHSVCLDAIDYCVRKGGAHAEPSHIRLLQDCAAICRTSADFMLRHSDFHGRVCEICAEICEECADDCEEFEHDPAMKSCAEVCRRCAESCRQMAQA